MTDCGSGLHTGLQLFEVRELKTLDFLVKVTVGMSSRVNDFW